MTTRPIPLAKQLSVLAIVVLCCAAFLASLAPTPAAAAPTYVSLDAKINSCASVWNLNRRDMQIRDNAPNYGGKYNAPSVNIVTWWCKGTGSYPMDQVQASKYACNNRVVLPYFEPSWSILWWKMDYQFKGWYCS